MFKSFIRSTPAPLALAAALALGAAGVSAATVDFTFDGAGGVIANGTTFSVGAYSVTASGYYSDATNAGAGWQTAQSLQRFGNALGVVRNATDWAPGQLDSNLVFADGILFDFGAPAQWSSITATFSLLSMTEEIDVWAGNTFTPGVVGSPLSIPVVTDGSLANLGLSGNPLVINPFSSRYLFIAAADDQQGVNNCGTSTNCFRVDNLQGVVNAAPPTGVPEPGSLALAGLALLGLGALRARSQKA